MKNFKLLIIMLPLMFVAVFASAGDYTAPAGTAPSSNTSTLVDTSAATQIKGDSSGGLSVNVFTALQNASFNQDVFFNGLLVGALQSGNNSILKFGGVDPTNVNRTVDVNITGKLHVTNGVYSNTIIAPYGELNVCATNDGTLIICP